MHSTARRSAAAGAVVALMIALALAAFQVAAATANPGNGMTIDLYSQLTDLTGTPAQPGDQAVVGRDLYVLGGDSSSPAPVGDPIGRLLGICTVITPTEGVCDGVFTFDGRGTLTAYLKLDLGTPGNVEAITGGTGEFAGAAGTIVETAVSGNPADHLYHMEVSGFSQP